MTKDQSRNIGRGAMSKSPKRKSPPPKAKCRPRNAKREISQVVYEPPQVAIELRAAALAAGAKSRKIERIGMAVHAVDCDGVKDDEPAIVKKQNDLDSGWLYNEIRTHDEYREIRDAHAWSWDISRLISDQELEIKMQYNAIGALCDVVKEAGGTMRLYGEPVTESELRGHAEQLVDDKLARITEQTRHDVAASVARHADLERIEEFSPRSSEPRSDFGHFSDYNLKSNIPVVPNDISVPDEGEKPPNGKLALEQMHSHWIIDDRQYIDQPAHTPSTAQLTDDLHAGEVAARQATRDGYTGPAAVLELEIGEEPEHGFEVELGTTCVCGCAIEEHGHDDEHPGSTACSQCPDGDCIAYESES